MKVRAVKEFTNAKDQRVRREKTWQCCHVETENIVGTAKVHISLSPGPVLEIPDEWDVVYFMDDESGNTYDRWPRDERPGKGTNPANPSSQPVIIDDVERPVNHQKGQVSIDA